VAGEWDVNFTNPLYRPQYKSSARIVSADDFANRPSVGFSGEFASLSDAMVTLSWLDQQDFAQIYQLYCDMMLSAEANTTSATGSGTSATSNTSHEYVMRVIAQQYNITAERVAAVVILSHNEQQMRMQNTTPLLEATANRMDALIQQEIKDAYESSRSTPPTDAFVEDPIGVNELQDRKKYRVADDVYDVDALHQAATVRLDQQARRIIDSHQYVLDVDLDAQPVPIDHDAQQLLTQHKTLQREMADQERTVQQQREVRKAVEPQWRTANGDGVTRPRWKFIAQTGTLVRTSKTIFCKKGILLHTLLSFSQYAAAQAVQAKTLFVYQCVGAQYHCRRKWHVAQWHVTRIDHGSVEIAPSYARALVCWCQARLVGSRAQSQTKRQGCDCYSVGKGGGCTSRGGFHASGRRVHDNARRCGGGGNGIHGQGRSTERGTVGRCPGRKKRER
jgi:hypothetical protein